MESCTEAFPAKNKFTKNKMKIIFLQINKYLLMLFKLFQQV